MFRAALDAEELAGRAGRLEIRYDIIKEKAKRGEKGQRKGQ